MLIVREYKCGCKITVAQINENCSFSIEYCSLHQSAPDMYETLTEISGDKGRYTMDMEDIQELAFRALAEADRK